jgi:dethiobiotin synthetase
MRWFVTGTDTDVGKTYFASLLVRALRKSGLDCVAMKPICCGDRTDSELLHAACEQTISIDEVNPVWLRTPAAPLIAARLERREIDLEQIRRTFRKLNASHRGLIVEGAGGWLVPVRSDYLMSDLAADFGLPVVVVVRNKLGALNHTLLTVQSIRARGLDCAGIILNHMDVDSDVAGRTNRAVLEQTTQAPILFEITRNQREMEIGLA